MRDLKVDNKDKKELTPRERARQSVKVFVKKMQYETYVRQGLSPENAARMIGIKLPPGLRHVEILRIIDREVGKET